MIYIDTDATELPTCPKCGGTDRKWLCNVTKGKVDGSEWVSKCVLCSAAYSVKIRVSTEFTTDDVTEVCA